MTALVLVSWLAAAPATKLPPDLAKEIAAAIVAVDKALGLESWPTHGAKPCVEPGDADNPTRTVSRDDTRRCTLAAVDKGFSGLGKSYVLAVLMTSVGPGTVIAVGMDQADGFGGYSCDPGRKCPPLKMVETTKWGKRIIERKKRACSDEQTLWIPEDHRPCGSPTPLVTPPAPK